MTWRERLRETLRDSARKQSFIAQQAQVDPATLSRIVNGHIEPRFDTVVRLAKALDVSVGWLLSEPVRGVELTAHEQATLRAAGAILLRTIGRGMRYPSDEPSDEPQSWRDRLRTAVDSSDHSRADIAQHVGITPSTLDSILNHNAEASFDLVAKTGAAAYASLNWLAWEQRTPEPLTYEDVRAMRRMADIIQRVLADAPE